MSDIKNKISNALYILENKREKFSNEKFLEHCKVVKRNIMKAFEEGSLTKDEAKPVFKRVNKLLYPSKKEFYKKETKRGIEKELEKISLELDLKKEKIKSETVEFKDNLAESIEEALEPSNVKEEEEIETEKYKETLNTKFCPKCSAVNKANAKFCYECGYNFKKPLVYESQSKIISRRETKFCQHCRAKIDAEAEICPNCGVRVEPPRYSPSQTTQRAGIITAASILLGIIGILEAITGMLVIVSGGLLIMLGGIIITIIGVITLLIAILYIVAAYWLWQSKKSGGILGIVLCAVSLPLNIILVMTLIVAFIGIIGFVLDILIIVFIAVGWNSLK